MKCCSGIELYEVLQNLSAIIGPNGSGKSNVIDSLLFVFGYRASKIRSKKISVLIHSSKGNENLQSCTVCVNFQKIIDRVSFYHSWDCAYHNYAAASNLIKNYCNLFFSNLYKRILCCILNVISTYFEQKVVPTHLIALLYFSVFPRIGIRRLNFSDHYEGGRGDDNCASDVFRIEMKYFDAF